MQLIEQPQALTTDFFTGRPTLTIARDLLGKMLLFNSPQGQLGGYIVETEAYLGAIDPGAHAYQGRRVPSNEPLYGAPGTIYIYAIRGYYDFDIVTQAEGEPEGILVRGLQPAIGEEQMRQNRTRPGFELSNGPAKLMLALNINDTKLNGQSVSEPPLQIITNAAKTPRQISTSPRIGVRTHPDWQDHYRVFVTGNPYVSKSRKRDYDLDTYGWQ